MFQRFSQKFAQFMVGRYGSDALNQRLSIYVLICMVISLVLGLLSNFLGAWAGWVSRIAGIAGWVCLIYFFIRFFSKNIPKRQAQNQRFLQKQQQSKARVQKAQNKKNYKYLTCPSCGQEMRVPRGKGKISVSCPKCGQKTLTHT